MVGDREVGRRCAGLEFPDYPEALGSARSRIIGNFGGRPAVTLHSNRFFRTFGANKKQKSPPINNLHDLSNHTFTLFPKSIQVVDWDRLVRSFLFEAAPKVVESRCGAVV
jgi:hypothetical protein